MKMVNFLKLMTVITFMAVLYIHLQVKIYDLAYQGKKKMQQIDKLSENNIFVTNDILRLQSSDHIGRQLLGQDNAYQFVSNRNVVQVEEKTPSLMGHNVTKKGSEFIGRVMTLAFSPLEPR